MLEKGVALSLFLLSAIYVHAATSLSYGALAAPKAGFLPLLAGSGALVLTGINLVRSLMARCEPGRPTDLRKALFFVAGLIGYIVALPLAGFAATTFVGTCVLLKVSGLAGWTRPLVTSAVLAGTLWVGFGQLLNLPLP